jgi:hypothetical protein
MQLTAWVPSKWQNLTQRENFRNAPSACCGDRNFQGFASSFLLFLKQEKYPNIHKIPNDNHHI